MVRHSEEVLNVRLGDALAKRGMVSAPETIRRGSGGGRRKPDVIVTFRGLRVILEGEVDASGAANRASAEARSRLDDGLAHVALAIVYPSYLRNVDGADLISAIEQGSYQVQLHTEGATGKWITVEGVDTLRALLAVAYEHMVKEDVVSEAVRILDDGLGRLATVFMSNPSTSARLMALLEVGEIDRAEEEAEDDG